MKLFRHVTLRELKSNIKRRNMFCRATINSRQDLLVVSSYFFARVHETVKSETYDRDYVKYMQPRFADK